MPTTYKWKPAYTIDEALAIAKQENRERAKEIPTLLRKKELEYHV
jgi:hypothetical protein